MENGEVFGAKPLQGVDVKVAREKADQLKQRMQQRMARHTQDFKAHPVKTTVRDSVHLAATGAGAALATVAVASAPLMYLAHRGNKMYASGSESGKGLAGDSMHHMKNYASNVMFSPFKQHDAMAKANATFYSGFKEQQNNRSLRDSVLSWFGLDDETEQFNAQDREKDTQELQALMEQKANDQRMKDEMAQRNAGMIPMAISQAFRDPAIRNYLTTRGLSPSKEPAAADAFFQNAATADAQKATATNPSRPFAYEAEPAPSYVAKAQNIQENTSRDDDTPMGLDADYTPVPPSPNGGQDYVAYMMSPEIMMEYDAMQHRAMEMYPSMEKAVMNGQTKWKGISDAIMVEDMKTLKEGAYLDYMAGGMEDGSISDVAEMDANAVRFEKQWGELENKEINAEYGDRIRAYEQGFAMDAKSAMKNFSADAENQRDVIMQKAQMSQSKAAQFINNVRQFGKDIGITKEDVTSVSRHLAADGLKSYHAQATTKNLSDAELMQAQANKSIVEPKPIKGIAPSVDVALMKDVSEPDHDATMAEAAPVSSTENRRQRALPSFSAGGDESFSAADVLNGLRDRSKINQAQPVAVPIPVPVQEGPSF